MISEKKIIFCKCERCGHEWHPKSKTIKETEKNIKICPKCKSAYWNIPKII